MFFSLLLPPCEYENCDGQAHDGATLCIFHDKNYLNGNNYDKHKDEVANKLQTKLLDNKPSNFQGYCLPEISFKNYEFSQPINFNVATFYGHVDFVNTTFAKETSFMGAIFSKEAQFYEATFKEVAIFMHAIFSKEASFAWATFAEGVSFERAT